MTTMLQAHALRGEWGGQVGCGWVPAIAGTLNQTGQTDEDASTFATHDDAADALEWLQTNVIDPDDDRVEFRIVEAT